MSLLLEMFTYPFILRAFVVGILVALCAWRRESCASAHSRRAGGGN